MVGAAVGRPWMAQILQLTNTEVAKTNLIIATFLVMFMYFFWLRKNVPQQRGMKRETYVTEPRKSIKLNFGLLDRSTLLKMTHTPINNAF
jgi:hypothetical protein